MKVLAIVAHPDDETLGCGGTLARHAAAGDHVSVLTFTDGVEARPTTGNLQALYRRRCFAAAMQTLGVRYGTLTEFEMESGFRITNDTQHGWRHAHFPDNRLDTVPLLALAQTVEQTLADFMPEVVYTHWLHDLNVDHRLVTQAVLTATRPPVSGVRAIYAFETPSSTEWAFGEPSFSPNVYVDITRTSSRKLDAMACYDVELRERPHPRSTDKLLALAAMRGAASGMDMAEAFVLLRSCVAQSKGVAL